MLATILHLSVLGGGASQRESLRLLQSIGSITGKTVTMFGKLQHSRDICSMSGENLGTVGTTKQVPHGLLMKPKSFRNVHRKRLSQEGLRNSVMP